ncbi:MAG: VCBS repeat-containing protein, partial [Planctomycetota bacterium]
GQVDGTFDVFSGFIFQELNIGTANSHLAVGDIDRDGILDIAFIGTNDSNLYIKRGTGDFNNDGLIDLATFETSSGSLPDFVVVYHNTGDGFTRVAEILLDNDTFEIDDVRTLAAGDVNNDGRDDLVFFNERSDDFRHYTLLNTSPAGNTFSLTLAHSQADFTYDRTTLADVTGDGNTDIIALSSTDNVIVIMPGRGDGTFRNGAVRTVFSPGGGGLQSSSNLLIVDVDGDARLDVLVERQTGGGQQTVLFHQSAPGVFDQSTIAFVASTTSSRHLSASDLNGDGRPELLTTRVGGGTESLFIIFNTSTPGSPSFTAQSYLLPDNTGTNTGVIAGDIDNDGRNELIVSGFFGARILELNAAGVPIAGASIAFTTSDVGPMQLIDMDSDGDLDWVITANSLGETNGVFVVSNRFAGPSRVSNVAPAIPGGSIFLSPQTVGSSATITYEDFLALSGVTDADGDEVRFRIVSVANGTLSGPGGIITGNNTFRPGTSITYTAPNSGGASVVAFRVTLSDPFGESTVVIPVRVPLISPLTAPPAPPPAEPDQSPGWLD